MSGKDIVILYQYVFDVLVFEGIKGDVRPIEIVEEFSCVTLHYHLG